MLSLIMNIIACVYSRFTIFLIRQNQTLTGVNGIFILNAVDLAELVQHCRRLIYFPADSHKTVSLLHIIISLRQIHLRLGLHCCRLHILRR